MLRVYSCIAADHDIRLLAVAIAICVFANLTSFMLVDDLRHMKGRARIRAVAVLAFVTASGIWATHFIAMLAYQPDLPSAYSPHYTALSYLACLGLTTAAFLCRSRFWAPVLNTAGIATMHFIGMAALETPGRFEYDWAMVAGAIAVGALLIRTATAAFYWPRQRIPWAATIIYSMAVASIHFGSMAAITIIPDPREVVSDSAISPQTLAVVVAMIVVAVLAVAFAMLRIEGRLAASAVEETNRLKLFADKAMEGLAVIEGDCIVDANDVFWEMAGFAPDEPPSQLSIGSVVPVLAQRSQTDFGASFFETAMVNARVGELDIEAALRGSSVSGQVQTLLVVRDISSRKAAAARIAHLASHDPLTGVGNRLTFNRVIEDRLATATPQEPLGLLCIDLDRFKAVNDLYGHLIGDAVLIEATRRIGEPLGKKDLLARLGGDEFAIMTNRTPATASQLAERVIAALSAPFHVDGQMISINASIGIAYGPTDADNAQSLHSKADLALYRAKNDGRGRFCFFDRAMDDQVIESFRMKAELRTALRDDQLTLHYQPLACLVTGDVIGFEALLRWHHPELGEISPATFIPLAEETGLIVAIGEWVLRTACDEAARWQHPLKISVNLSPVQFTAGNIVELAASALANSGLDPRRLDLEITEGVLVKDADSALRMLRSLKALGVTISMDDFGTGYSSLSYFRQFPFDKVKIDQGFIQDMEVNPQSRAIIKAIIGLAKGLDIAILAEGVETARQIEMLKAKGCQEIQGFAVSRPAPIEHFGFIVGERDGAADNGAFVARLADRKVA